MLTELLEKIKTGDITANEAAAHFPSLTWAERNVDPDGTIWWSEGNEASDIDVAIITGEISPDQGNVLYNALEELL